ncbi:putative terminase large subunit [Sinorhizobium fredii HH103]|uniref:Terminase large subunit n=1 Tax=Sinorhizobium fredii (strain HH103) TaxID=1117943 RepID=G9A7D1_SINF1|nr:terminase TerL endonuclease subunit [Sinorhizobium fredii]CCE96161.1 putative terminase large subunit [Sinorhizobium fredii HH103]
MAAPYPLAVPYPDWLAEVVDDPMYAWAVSGWDRAAAVPGAWFDHAKAEKVVERWPEIFRLTNDRFKGVPFRLVKWQAITVRLLVGWKKPIEVIDPATHKPSVEHVRVFRRLDLWIPRKNGKSEFLAALAVLFFVLEKVHGAEAYVFGRNEDQGRVPFGKMQDIIREADGLMEDAQGNERISLHDKSIFLRETTSLCQLLTGAPDGKHGRSPTVIVGDEIHEWKTRELADTLRQGTGARLQPIELYASTAGRKQNRTGFEWFEESIAIMRDDIDDPTTLVVYFGIDEDDDWTDEATWRKANPSLGLTPTLDYLRTEFKKAKGRPAQEAIFQCYHLNRWVDQLSGWIPRPKWAACTADAASWKVLWTEHKGRKAYLACDVSSTRDITALVVVVPPDDEHDKWVIIPLFWVPEDTLDERAEQDRRVDWKKWVREEALLTTPGDSVDQTFVQEAIKDACAQFEVQAFGFDPWNARKLAGDLQHDGMDAELQIEMRQGHQTLSGPTKEFERLVFAGKVEHGGHPVLAWMAGHCTVRFDVNLNYVPDKKNSLDKIDGIIATVMGVGLAMGEEESGMDDYFKSLAGAA